MKVAIVGAGVAGLACARELADAGVQVQCFEKGLEAGGRISTRRVAGLTFDHGAQYFTMRDEDFAVQVLAWREAGVAAIWEGRIAVARDGMLQRTSEGSQRWVGTPSMSAIAAHLAAPLEVMASVEIVAIEPAKDGWWLRDQDEGSHGGFDAVVVATPAAEAVPLLMATPELAAQAEAVVMEPCWAVMLAFDCSLPVSAEGLFVHDSPLAWIARDGSKPGRDDPNTWVLHATPDWTRDHWDDAPELVVRALSVALGDAVGVVPPPRRNIDVQRWRYARADVPLPERYLFDATRRIGACGDWCGGPRIEGAWLSGRALAQQVLASA